MKPEPSNSRPSLWPCLLLAAVALAVYLPALRNGFVDFDDLDYVTENVRVSAGLTGQGILWAFQGPHSANWHPLTTLSHMLDCELFGLQPWGHHLGNVLFHAANAALLFLLLRQLTGSRWRSAFVAAVFALHPLHVESVAWVSERKDVLSTFFGFLTLMAYARFARIPPGAAPREPRRWYGLALVLFALSLMSKPMMVTLPCLMLLLDFWPLQRNEWNDWHGWGRRVVEKLPFFALSAASSIVTYLVQKQSGAVAEHLAMSVRVSNAVVAYLRYLGKTFWPVDLAVFYPLANPAPSLVLVSALVLLLLTGLAFWRARTHGFLLTGWLWFLGLLVPVIGIVQVGSQSMADRYSYITQTGVVLAVTWTIAGLWGATRTGRRMLGLVASVCLLLLAGLTVRQIRCWRDTETLFAQAVAATTDNARAHAILGYTMAGKGRREEGVAHVRRALEIHPGFGEAHGKLGHLLEMQGDYPGAIASYRKALDLTPNLPEALNNLAWIRSAHPDPALRDGAEGVRLAERACALTRHGKTLYMGTLAAAYAEAGRFDDAIAMAGRARDHALRWGETALAQKNAELLELYRAGNPYRDPAMSGR